MRRPQRCNGMEAADESSLPARATPPATRHRTVDILTDGRNTDTLDLVTVSGLELSELEVFDESGEICANIVPEPAGAAGIVAPIAALAGLLHAR